MSLCPSFTRLYILFTKNKMVVIGNKRNKKTRNRLPQKKRRQWNVREKLMIVHYFENNNRNVRGTAKKFNIQPKQVSEKRADGNAVTRKLITNKAISLSKSPEFLMNNQASLGSNFLVSGLMDF